MTARIARPTAKEMSIAVACLVLAVGGAFLAASLTQDKPIFTLAPPGGTPEDVFREDQRLNLHRTFFTAWATLILVTPALCTFLFRRTSEIAARYWQAFWTVSFIAFVVHFIWAVSVLFQSDWGRILDAHKRVSEPIWDTVVAAWWGLDVLLAWLVRDERLWIRIQRVVVHAAVFVLFFVGSAKEGELKLSTALGGALGGAVLTSFVIWLARWLKQPKGGAAPAV